MDLNRTFERARTRIPRNMNQMQALPSQGLKIVPSDIFLWAAGASVLISLGLKLAGRNQDSLFVGEWAPTMVGLGVLSRLIGR